MCWIQFLLKMIEIQSKSTAHCLRNMKLWIPTPIACFWLNPKIYFASEMLEAGSWMILATWLWEKGIISSQMSRFAYEVENPCKKHWNILFHCSIWSRRVMVRDLMVVEISTFISCWFACVFQPLQPTFLMNFNPVA